MSLILEALRKSEAERRRGQAPDLHAELPPLASGRPRRMPLWVGIATALVVLVSGTWWLLASRPARLPDPPAPTSTPLVSSQPPVPAASSPYPRVERIAPVPATQPAPAQRESTVAAQPPPPTPTPVPAGAVPASSPGQGTTPAKPIADTVQPSPPQSPAGTAPTPRAEPARPTAVPTVAELPAAERDQLPALKLTMHMWNERPSQRFVILDGSRYGEGDRIGAATIARIDTDGVVLELNGRAVRLPLR